MEFIRFQCIVIFHTNQSKDGLEQDYSIQYFDAVMQSHALLWME